MTATAASSSTSATRSHALFHVLWRAALVAGLGAVAAMLLQPPVTRTIVGDSMAPNLVGTHLLWQCPDCGYKFTTTIGEQRTAISAELRTALFRQWDTTATCPNCGQGAITRQHARPRGPQTAVIDDTAKPRRFDLAAYRTPEGIGMVKRVVGLPGEHVRINDGDLWVNGRRVEKTLEQTRSMAILVNDGEHESEHIERWRAEPGSHWSRHGIVRKCRGNGRLIYQHRVSFESPQPRTTPAAIRDHYAFNLFVSRRPRRVHDLLFETWLRTSGDQSIWITLNSHDGGLTQEASTPSRPSTTKTKRVTFQAIRQSNAFRWSVLNASSKQSRAIPSDNTAWHHVSVASLDGRAILAVDGRVLMECPLSEIHEFGTVGPPQVLRDGHPAAPSQAGEAVRMSFRGHTSRAFALVSALRLWRDLRYDAVLGKPAQWQLGPAEWFFLGDNVPTSIDSRWSDAVASSSLLGRVQVD